MATQVGIIRYSGRIGNVVGYVVNGRQMVRSAPQAHNSKSPEQERQRARFSELTQLAKSANEWQKRYSKALNYKASAYNNIVAYNRDYLHKESAEPASLRLPHTYATISATLTDVTLTGRKLSATLSELSEGVSVCVVVLVGGKAISHIYTEGGAIALDIPADIKTGDIVHVMSQAGDASGLAPSVVQSVTAQA